MKKRLLLIEDNYQNRYMMRFLLEREGFLVEEAENGKDGIRLALMNSPDVILLDIQLPEMDGYTVLGELKRCEKLKNIPVIAVTSYAMAGDRERILEKGADGYIEKPINPDTFVSEILAFLERKGKPHEDSNS